MTRPNKSGWVGPVTCLAELTADALDSPRARSVRAVREDLGVLRTELVDIVRLVRRAARDTLQGRQPVWAAEDDNDASITLTAKLGFQPVDRLAVLSPHP